MVGRLSPHLLRRHVAHRAHHHSRFRPLGERQRAVLRTGLRLRQLRQSEVQNLHPPVLGDEQVLRFQIAMDNAFLMRRGQPARNLHSVINRLAHRQTAPLDLLPQRFAFQQLRDQIRRAFVCAHLNTRPECWDDSMPPPRALPARSAAAGRNQSRRTTAGP